MSDDLSGPKWTFCKFGLLVTGKGEEEFLPSFLRSLTNERDCSFQVVRRISQRSPVKSEKRRLKMVGSGKTIPDADATEIGLPARNFLDRHPGSHVIIVDDLEYDRREIHQETFDRYRAALDGVMPDNLSRRASVHFLVYMLEAYYFAHADAINAVLGTDLHDYAGDVEEIRHPKGYLKEIVPIFDEVRDGHQIVARLDFDRILANPATCTSLRSLFKWCVMARRGELTDRFQLLDGECSPITGPQIAFLTNG